MYPQFQRKREQKRRRGVNRSSSPTGRDNLPKLRLSRRSSKPSVVLPLRLRMRNVKEHLNPTCSSWISTNSHSEWQEREENEPRIKERQNLGGRRLTLLERLTS